eukprot:5639040-Prymnesium_polylepis.3
MEIKHGRGEPLLLQLARRAPPLLVQRFAPLGGVASAECSARSWIASLADGTSDAAFPRARCIGGGAQTAHNRRAAPPLTWQRPCWASST